MKQENKKITHDSAGYTIQIQNNVNAEEEKNDINQRRKSRVALIQKKAKKTNTKSEITSRRS